MCVEIGCVVGKIYVDDESLCFDHLFSLSNLCDFLLVVLKTKMQYISLVKQQISGLVS